MGASGKALNRGWVFGTVWRLHEMQLVPLGICGPCVPKTDRDACEHNGGDQMRTARNIFAAAFAVLLASGLAACEADQTEFQETPPAEEIEVFEEQPAGQQQPRRQQQPMQPSQQQGQQGQQGQRGQQGQQAPPPAQQHQ